MLDRNVKWICYTVLIGLVPVLSRALVWVVASDRRSSILNPTDLILFGLILHISNINEIEHFASDHRSWKSIYNALSILFIVMYAVLFTCVVFDEFGLVSVHYPVVRNIAVSLSAMSFVLSLTIYYRSAKLGS